MIRFRRFNLEAYDKNKHYALEQKMERDNGVQEFISHRFSQWLDSMPNEKEGFHVNQPYVVVKDNKYVGIVGTLNLADDGIVELWCAIDKDERGKGYGDGVLGEMTNYLIEDFDDIRLKIKKYNITSKNRAKGNGYVLDEVESSADNEHDIYYYFGKKR